MEVRQVRHSELSMVWKVLIELRPRLTWLGFKKSYAIQERDYAYFFLAAFIEGKVVGVAGMRPVHTFARGPYLHIDDLVVASHARGRGVGASLLQAAEKKAKNSKLDYIFLDSDSRAIPFYTKHGYREHESTLVKKQLKFKT